MTPPIPLKELEPFCYLYNDEKGASYRRPWTRGGFTFATDCRMFLWIPAIEGVEDQPDAPDLAALLSTFPEPEATAFLDGLPASVSMLNEWDSCPYCGAAGRVESSSADATCEECLGLGKLPNMERHRIGSCLIAACFLVRMSRLPDLRVAADSGGPLQPLHFHFGSEGKGMVMPMKDSDILK